MFTSTALRSVNDQTFAREVLASPLPVLVLVGAPRCLASRAQRPLLQQMAEQYSEQLRVVRINAESDTILREQFGVQMTPTLLVFQYGELRTRVIGFLPVGLLQLLCAQIADGCLPNEAFWSPIEAVFEEQVVVPLLNAWGLRYARQVVCPAPMRGRIDFLVYDADDQPLSLFENKRHILSPQAQRQAMIQAHNYARAWHIPSFVLAAPAGIWIYASNATSTRLMRQISAIELPHTTEQILELLHQLRN